jgi:hypothetical protein
VVVTKFLEREDTVLKKKIDLEVGQVFAIELKNIWTIGQLCFNFVKDKYSQQTMAFFNYKFNSLENILQNVQQLDLSEPIFIISLNGHPVKNYRMQFVGMRGVNYKNVPDFKNDICSSLGSYKDSSSDPELYLEPYFGLFPWDGYYKPDFVDKELLPNAKKRDDIKYCKDFTIDELKELMPPNSKRLKEILSEQ